MDAFEPIVIETHDAEVGEPIHLFTIDDVPYFMPAEVPPSLALQVLDMVRHEGDAAASMWVLEEVLGEDGYQALINCRGITKDQLTQIMAIVNDHVMGQLSDDESEGNGQGPNRAARRSVSPGASANGHSGGRGSQATKRTSTRTSGGSTGSRRKAQRTS